MLLVFIITILAHVFVQEAPIFNIYGAGAEILVFQQDPNVHLPFVECAANFIEVDIHDGVKILLVHALQLLKSLLKLLLSLIEKEHRALLPFKELGQELSLVYSPSSDCLPSVKPVSSELGECDPEMLIEIFASVSSHKEFG